MVLPDVLIDEYKSDLKTENLAKMINLYESSSISQIMVETVPEEDVSKYGVVDLQGAEIFPGGNKPMEAVVEKPKREEASSTLAVVGRYILCENIWGLLKVTPPGAGDEIQLTDAIASLIEQEQIDAFYMTGKSHDCGSKLGYMKAFVEGGLKHDAEGGNFVDWIESLM